MWVLQFCQHYLKILPLYPIHVMLDGDGVDTWRTMPHNYLYPGLNPHWKWKQPRMSVLSNSYFQLPASAAYMDIILCNTHFHINFILTENENWELQHLMEWMNECLPLHAKHQNINRNKAKGNITTIHKLKIQKFITTCNGIQCHRWVSHCKEQKIKTTLCIHVECGC